MHRKGKQFLRVPLVAHVVLIYLQTRDTLWVTQQIMITPFGIFKLFLEIK